MNAKRSIMAACSILVLSVGAAVAGPCSTTNDKDAGSGPVTVGQAQSQPSTRDATEHPPTSAMNRASGGTASSSEDAQRQMQSQPTAAERAEGAKPHTQSADKGC